MDGLQRPRHPGDGVELVSSADLSRWEQPAIVAWPGCFERMETPQRWQRGDRVLVARGSPLAQPSSESAIEA